MLADLRREDGFTLVEVLVVCVLMLVVMGATLTTFESFQQNVSTNERQNTAQDTARNAMDLMARDLRNLASPSKEQPLALDLKADQQIIFQSEGRDMPAGSLNAANTQPCPLLRQPDGRPVPAAADLDDGDLPGNAGGHQLPGRGWTTTKLVAEDVVNSARPIFYYNADLTR